MKRPSLLIIYMEEGEFHVNSIEIIFNKIRRYVTKSRETDAHLRTRDIQNIKEIETDMKLFVSYESK